MMTQTILNRPLCKKCKIELAIVAYRHLWVCGNCAMELQRKEQLWLEERLNE